MQYPNGAIEAHEILEQQVSDWLTIKSPYEARMKWQSMELLANRFGILLSVFLAPKNLYKCATCGESFKSQAALSGHGKTRCSTKTTQNL